MIPGLMSLPVITRYKIIIAWNQHLNVTQKELASRLGVCRNTIGAALAWDKSPVPRPRQGRPWKLSDPHKQHIRVRTTSDRHLSNGALVYNPAAYRTRRRMKSVTTVGKPAINPWAFRWLFLSKRWDQNLCVTKD
jgi:hypothetical protein